jgi:hypothetical protein
LLEGTAFTVCVRTEKRNDRSLLYATPGLGSCSKLLALYQGTTLVVPLRDQNGSGFSRCHRKIRKKSQRKTAQGRKSLRENLSHLVPKGRLKVRLVQIGLRDEIACTPTENSGRPRGAPQIPPLRSPGFPVDLDGVGALHAPFFTEGRTRGLVQCSVAGNPGTLRSG